MELEIDWKDIHKFANRLGNLSKFEQHIERVTKDIAKALLKQMKSLTPVDEYDLINGWDGNKFAVAKTDGGFEVLIVNKTPYALAVNDGHMAYNQYGGPYPIKHRKQVRIPHRWQEGDATYYVFGHFFVERGMVKLTNTREIESIIMRELEKWWEGCING